MLDPPVRLLYTSSRPVCYKHMQVQKCNSLFIFRAFAYVRFIRAPPERCVSFIRLIWHPWHGNIMQSPRYFRFIRFSGIYEILFTQRPYWWVCACERQFRHFSPNRWQKRNRLAPSKHSQDQLVSKCDTCESKSHVCNERAKQQQHYVHLTNVHAALNELQYVLF